MGRSPRTGLALALAEAALAALMALLCAMGAEGCRAATLLGSDRLYYLAGLLLYLAVDAREGAAAVSALALAGGLVVALKTWLGLPRPPSSMWLAPAEGPGFPSGHTAAATAFWLSISLPWGAAAAAAALAVAAVVGYTRLALHVHYPRDVVGGFLVGAFSALASHRLRGRRPEEVILLLSAPGLAASLAALALDPGYRGAARMLGVTLGLAAAAAAMTARGCTPRTPGPARARAVLAAAGLSALAAAVALERLLAPPLGSVAGFAVFAFTVAVLPCAASRGARGGRRPP